MLKMEQLLNKQKTAFISSINDNNIPQASYAPYVIIKDKIYIYISKVAEHYKNLENNKNVSLMIIEDESNCKILFARKRLTFKGLSRKVSEVSSNVKEKFEEVHTKNMMDMLYKMDFDFFEIQILNGRLVEGFGKAYDISYNLDSDTWEQQHIIIDNAHKK